MGVSPGFPCSEPASSVSSTPMALPRIYVDTSVLGGCFDPEFERESRRLVESARAGRVVFLMSDVVAREVGRAPLRVRELVKSLPAESLIEGEITTAVIELRDAYLAAGVLGRSSLDDATHMAAATVSRADAIVSWNFKHIVQLQRIAAYNEVNAELGYPALSIVSPMEVRFDD